MRQPRLPRQARKLPRVAPSRTDPRRWSSARGGQRCLLPPCRNRRLGRWPGGLQDADRRHACDHRYGLRPCAAPRTAPREHDGRAARRALGPYRLAGGRRHAGGARAPLHDPARQFPSDRRWRASPVAALATARDTSAGRLFPDLARAGTRRARHLRRALRHRKRRYPRPCGDQGGGRLLRRAGSRGCELFRHAVRRDRHRPGGQNTAGARDPRRARLARQGECPRPRGQGARGDVQPTRPPSVVDARRNHWSRESRDFSRFLDLQEGYTAASHRAAHGAGERQFERHGALPRHAPRGAGRARPPRQGHAYPHDGLLPRPRGIRPASRRRRSPTCCAPAPRSKRCASGWRAAAPARRPTRSP